MSKKNRREKEVSKLRRELEILKTQIRAGEPEKVSFDLGVVTKRPAENISAVNVNSLPTMESTTIDYSYLKNDLLRTAILSIGAFASIFILYFYTLHK